MEDIEGKVEKVSLVHLAVATLYGFLSFFFIFSLSLRMTAVYGMSAIFGLCFSLPMAVWHFWTATHLKHNGPRGIKASLFPSIFLLLLFPVGTVVGIYLLSVSKQVRESGLNA